MDVSGYRGMGLGGGGVQRGVPYWTQCSFAVRIGGYPLPMDVQGFNCSLKVVALAIMSKSNLNNFWWIGTVVGLKCVSAVL